MGLSIKAPVYDGQGTQVGSTKIKGNANKANYALATAQNKWNIEQWQRQNEYNSPANQIALLKEAGLNPNLYANSGATAESLTSADMANQQDMSGQYLNAMQMGLTNYNAELDRQLQRKQIELEKDKVDLESKRVENESEQTKSNVELNDVLKSKYGVDMELTKEQANTQRKEQEQIDSQIAERSERVNMLIKQNRDYDEDRAIRIAKDKAQTNEMHASAKKLAADAHVSEEMIYNMQLEATNLQIDYLLKGQAYDFNDIMNELTKDLKKWDLDHKERNWWTDFGFRLFDSLIDAGSTFATYGIGRAIGQAGKGIGQGISTIKYNPSPQSWTNEFLYKTQGERLLRGMPAY